jgi:hypothetical protein
MVKPFFAKRFYITTHLSNVKRFFVKHGKNALSACIASVSDRLMHITCLILIFIDLSNMKCGRPGMSSVVCLPIPR